MRLALTFAFVCGVVMAPAAFALPTPAHEDDAAVLEKIKAEAWGVVLPEPEDLLLDDEEGEVLFDAPTEGEQPKTAAEEQPERG